MTQVRAAAGPDERTKAESDSARPGPTNGKLHAPRRLDIACGQRKKDGYKGIDIAGDADIVHDLFEIPWPIRTSSVREIWCAHFVEHIPHERPGWEKDGWWRFFDEIYRILAPGGKAEFVHPYAKHDRAFWDPTHVRYINETTWYYLNADWRRHQQLDHYPTEVDFDIPTIDAMGLADEFMSRNQEMQGYARIHYWNVIPDLRVILESRKGKE